MLQMRLIQSIFMFLLVAFIANASTVISPNNAHWQSAPDINTLYSPILSESELGLLKDEYQDGAKKILFETNKKKVKKYFEKIYKETFHRPGDEPNPAHAYAAYELAHYYIYDEFDPWYNGTPSLFKLSEKIRLPEKNEKLICKLINCHCNYKTRALMLYVWGCQGTYLAFGSDMEIVAFSDLLPAIWAVQSDDQNFVDCYLTNFFFKREKPYINVGGFKCAWKNLIAADFWNRIGEGYYPHHNTLASAVHKMWKSFEILPYMVASGDDWDKSLCGKTEFELSSEIYKNIKEENGITAAVVDQSLLSVYFGNDSNLPIFMEAISHFLYSEFKNILGNTKGEERILLEKFIHSDFVWNLREYPEFKRNKEILVEIENQWNARFDAEIAHLNQQKAERAARRAKAWNSVFQILAMSYSQPFIPYNSNFNDLVQNTLLPQFEFIYNPTSETPISSMTTIQGNVWQQLACESINQVEAQNYANFLQFQESSQRLGQSVTYDQFMALQGAGLQNIGSSNYKQSDTKKTLTSHDCPWCGGTGKTLHESAAPTFGLSTSEKRCYTCGVSYPSNVAHTHIDCAHCGGTGKMK